MIFFSQYFSERNLLPNIYKLMFFFFFKKKKALENNFIEFLHGSHDNNNNTHSLVTLTEKSAAALNINGNLDIDFVSSIIPLNFDFDDLNKIDKIGKIIRIWINHLKKKHSYHFNLLVLFDSEESSQYDTLVDSNPSPCLSIDTIVKCNNCELDSCGSSFHSFSSECDVDDVDEDDDELVSVKAKKKTKNSKPLISNLKCYLFRRNFLKFKKTLFFSERMCAHLASKKRKKTFFS